MKYGLAPVGTVNTGPSIINKDNIAEGHPDDAAVSGRPGLLLSPADELLQTHEHVTRPPIALGWRSGGLRPDRRAAPADPAARGGRPGLRDHGVRHLRHPRRQQRVPEPARHRQLARRRRGARHRRDPRRDADDRRGVRSVGRLRRGRDVDHDRHLPRLLHAVAVDRRRDRGRRRRRDRPAERC